MEHAPPKVNILKCFLVKVDECSDLGVVRTGRRPCLCLDLLHDYLSHLSWEGRVPQTTTCVVSAKQIYKDVAFLGYKLLCMGLSWIPVCLVINWMMRINQDEKQSEIHNSLKMIKFLFSKLYGWERDFKKAKRAPRNFRCQWALTHKEGFLLWKTVSLRHNRKHQKGLWFVFIWKLKVSFHFWKEWKIMTQNMAD